jgi:hypothetical protein
MKHVGFEVLTAVVMNVAVLCDIAPCSRRFGGTYHLHLQRRKSAEQETSVQKVARQNSKDGGDTFLRNVGSHTDYTALYLRRW